MLGLIAHFDSKRLLRGSLLAAASAAAFLFQAQTAQATTITYSGSLVDLGSGWRTASVNKGAFSSSGILGQNGYIVLGAQGSTVLPSYLTGVTGTASTYPGNSGYALIDNPLTTPGSSPSTIVSGTDNPSVGAGNNATLLTFTLASSIPSVFQVGLMIDNLDYTVFNDATIGISGPGASAAFSVTGAAYNDRTPDWIFFNIAGGSAGQTYSIIAGTASTGQGTLGAISFDTVATPEPASIGLFGLGLTALALVRRRIAEKSLTA